MACSLCVVVAVSHARHIYVFTPPTHQQEHPAGRTDGVSRRPSLPMGRTHTATAAAICRQKKEEFRARVWGRGGERERGEEGEYSAVAGSRFLQLQHSSPLL